MRIRDYVVPLVGGVVLVVAVLYVSALRMTAGHDWEELHREDCAVKLGGIYAACGAYSSDYGGAYPDDLAQLWSFVREGGPWDRWNHAFLCVTCADDDRESTPVAAAARALRTSYVYVSGLMEGDPESCVLMYDRLAKHGRDQRQVLFLDGSVKLMRTDELEAALAETRTHVEKRRGAIRLLYGFQVQRR